MMDNALLEFLIQTLEEKVSRMKEYEHRLEAERDYYKAKFESLKELVETGSEAMADELIKLRKQSR